MRSPTIIIHYCMQTFEIIDILNKFVLLMWKKSVQAICEKYLDNIKAVEKRLKKDIVSIVKIEKLNKYIKRCVYTHLLL